MRLQPRLALSHGIVILLAMSMFPVALYGIHHLAASTDSLIGGQMKTLANSDQLRQTLGSEYLVVVQHLLAPNEELKQQMLTLDRELRQSIDDARAHYTSPLQKVALNEFIDRYAHFQSVIAVWQAGQMNPKNISEIPQSLDEARLAVIKLHNIALDSIMHTATETKDFAQRIFIVMGSLAALLLLLGMWAMVRMIGGIMRPVKHLGELAQRLGAGDFEIRFQRTSIDEFNVLGKHFETMGGALQQFRATNLDQLVAEQRRNMAVLDSIDDGLVIFAETGSIERINPVAERQLGVSAEKAIGRSFEDISGNHEIQIRIKEVLEGREPANRVVPELVVDRADEQRILAYSLTRFDESSGGRSGVVLVLRDVTIERAFNKMRSEFVLRASHELRTPVTSIRMGLGILEEKLNFAAGSRERELYDTVQEELQRMVRLLTDLLDLSRLQTGRQVLERLPVDINELLTRAQQRFSLQATTAGIKLGLDLESGLPSVSLDRTQFDRVLDNLISNALRHSSEGGSITLTGRVTSDRVAIGVTDTGEGIPPVQHALIFQPFVQIGKRRGGAGLGLAICKEIVQQHGGEIQMASMRGHGTTFTVLLPR